MRPKIKNKNKNKKPKYDKIHYLTDTYDKYTPMRRN